MAFTLQPTFSSGLSGYIAEILSGLVLADLGIAHHPRPDHAAYLASWLRVLAEDPRGLFTAASKAQQAADWMHEQQPVPASSGFTDETEVGQPGSPAVAGNM
ncbi:zincin-like metallopeptidase domain-containing protein [Paracoccus actinidiae]|uniref:zincin-like metallopeptidase domain-containing protein n=1 Tax=Paracoccus actinidiae TaxID=3064531 RepID=UPI0027D23635|nr:zincin-like metallopeptidase domain-containing protein [Paracoccus sp. M09]